MKKNYSASADALAGAPRHKKEDDAAFKARWIPYGMALKARGDALGVEWRGKSMEKYEAEICFYETLALPEGEMQDA